MTIAEVSRQYQLTADTLRYYERVGLIPGVRRNASGIRDYSEGDCRRVEFIKCMRAAGLPIEVLVDYMALYRQGDASIAARRELLIEQRRLLVLRMEDMQRTLDRLTYKIDGMTRVQLEQRLRQQ